MKLGDGIVAVVILVVLFVLGFQEGIKRGEIFGEAKAREEAYLEAYGEAFLRARSAEFVQGNLYIDCSKKESIGLTIVVLPSAPIQINGDAALKDFNVYQF